MIARLPGWQKIKSAVVCSNDATFLKLQNLISYSLFSFLFLSIFSAPVFANGLSITNPELVDNIPASDTSDFEFDITWNNSWRDVENNDAVWVFVKYCVTNCTNTDGTAIWNHATLKTSGTNPSGVSRGSGTLLDIIVTSDKKGAFIQRTGQGSGTVTTTDINLVWDYAADGVSDASAIASTTRIKVFGIEMVYVPQSAFYLGDVADGTAAATPFNFEYGLAASSVPGLVADGSALTFGAGVAGSFYYNNSGANDAADGTVFTIPTAFPLGFSAFYCMKYEISQGQWVDFFNTLTAAQRLTRDITAAAAKNSDGTVNRNTVSWTGTGVDATTASIDDRAMNFLSWMDLAAYLDWSALTPMSESQYEKAARGPLYAVTNEFPWGSTAVTTCAALNNDGATNETCATGGAAVTAASGIAGPTRVGMYAAGATTRATSGGSYWGVMDLAGNVNEQVVNIGGISAGSFTSRQFAGTKGDGVLTSLTSFEGNATNQDWPGLSTTNTQGVTTAKGTGFKGGAWNTTTASPSILRTGNRVSVSIENSVRFQAGVCPGTCTSTSGGRGVRSDD